MKIGKLLISSMLAVVIALGLSACTSNLSPNEYSTSQAGQASQTQRGVILAAEQVTFTGAGGGAQGIGTLAGAVAGGVGGSAIGGGTRMNVLGAVGGALAGGVLGNMAENKLTTQQGRRYQIALNGSRNHIITVTQGLTPDLTVGQHVFVIYGNTTRVIADTTSK